VGYFLFRVMKNISEAVIYFLFSVHACQPCRIKNKRFEAGSFDFLTLRMFSSPK
jgi:hypothetical protein